MPVYVFQAHVSYVFEALKLLDPIATGDQQELLF